MFKSIKIKLIVLVGSILFCVLALQIIFNIVFVKDFYTYKKNRLIEEVYLDITVNYTGDVQGLLEKIKQYEEELNLQITVMDENMEDINVRNLFAEKADDDIVNAKPSNDNINDVNNVTANESIKNTAESNEINTNENTADENNSNIVDEIENSKNEVIADENIPEESIISIDSYNDKNNGNGNNKVKNNGNNSNNKNKNDNKNNKDKKDKDLYKKEAKATIQNDSEDKNESIS
ncbi:MAG: hypothetical protein K0S55_1009, partial [Clostridia bacterium]|nr:hypothetical protein [Clostridia bacterium]